MQRLNATQKAQLLPIVDNNWQTLNVILPTEMLVKRAGKLGGSVWTTGLWQHPSGGGGNH